MSVFLLLIIDVSQGDLNWEFESIPNDVFRNSSRVLKVILRLQHDLRKKNFLINIIFFLF